MICKLLTNECFNCSDLENGIVCCLWEKLIVPCNAYRTQCLSQMNVNVSYHLRDPSCLFCSKCVCFMLYKTVIILLFKKMLMQGKFNIQFVNSNIKKSHDFMYLTLWEFYFQTSLPKVLTLIDNKVNFLHLDRIWLQYNHTFPLSVFSRTGLFCNSPGNWQRIFHRRSEPASVCFGDPLLYRSPTVTKNRKTDRLILLVNTLTYHEHTLNIQIFIWKNILTIQIWIKGLISIPFCLHINIRNSTSIPHQI